MTRDLLRTLRWLYRNPAFTLSVIAILALGIGANTTVFSVVDAVLLRPPDFESPEKLVQIKGGGSRRGWVSQPEYEFLEGRADLFQKTAAYSRDMVTLTGGNEPDQVFAVSASAAILTS